MTALLERPPDVETIVDPGQADGHSPRHTVDRRVTLALGLAMAAAGIVVGSLFTDIAARADAILAAWAGIGLAVLAVRARRNVLTVAVLVIGLGALGIVADAVFAGPDHVASLWQDVGAAIANGRELRPPVDFLAGWTAVLAWVLGCVGAGCGWVAFELGRRGIALLLPMVLCAIVAVSVPHDQQVVTGVAVLALYGAAIGVLAGGAAAGEVRSLGFEARRTLRALPLLLLVCGLLVALAQTNVLFPAPLVDPTTQPQKPHVTSLSSATDSVLFEADASVSGPWPLGSLDVYDGTDWLLAPQSQSRLVPVSASGVVDTTLPPGADATLTIRGLSGAVLPGLPNTIGVVASGPSLAWDARTGTIRLVEGSFDSGFRYKVVAAVAPTPATLAGDHTRLPASDAQFLQIPPPPPAIRALLGQAPSSSPYARMDFLRRAILDTVTATGTGIPVSVTPDRVQDMLTGSRTASPFEIVAAEAMAARWAGVPSRIGYGFDGGTKSGTSHYVIHQHDGAVWLEANFPGHGWVPFIASPTHARSTLGNDPTRQHIDTTVLPSDDVAVILFLPVVTPPDPDVAGTVRAIVLLVVAGGLLAAAGYWSWPYARKTLRRQRLRSRARSLGPRARIVLAYAEWRDACADHGYRHDGDTPLQFCERFVPDEEHAELAWLTTRALWSDLRDADGRTADELADHAQELSRALVRRISAAHSFTLRLVAAVSRESVRHPYVTDIREIAAPREAVAHAT